MGVILLVAAAVSVLVGLGALVEATRSQRRGKKAKVGSPAG